MTTKTIYLSVPLNNAYIFRVFTASSGFLGAELIKLSETGEQTGNAYKAVRFLYCTVCGCRQRKQKINGLFGVLLRPQIRQ